jgi:hypothetical protein
MIFAQMDPIFMPTSRIIQIAVWIGLGCLWITVTSALLGVIGFIAKSSLIGERDRNGLNYGE